MLFLWFAFPFYHSLPENATRSCVPRLNAPMGIPRPHVSRHVSGRAPRRGRRPRRPASAHHRIPVYSRLILRRGRRPRRPASAHLRIPAHSRLSLRRGGRPRRPVRFSSKGRDVSRSGATSFCPRRQKDAKTPPKTRGLWISFRPIATAVQKGSAVNRLYPRPRCRSRVPRGGVLLLLQRWLPSRARPVPEGAGPSPAAAGRNGAAGGSDPSAAGSTA